MTTVDELSHLCNALANSDQLEHTASRLDGVPADLELSVRFASARLLQAIGVLLRLPQDQIARSLVIFYRLTVGAEGASFLVHDAQDLVCGCIYAVAKPSAHPVSPRNLLTARCVALESIKSGISRDDTTDICFLKESAYLDQKQALSTVEAGILRTLGYQTHVSLPYTLCINYLQTMGLVSAESGELAQASVKQLNSSLLSPQLLFLTHQPYAIATAAIYLAAKQIGVKLPDCEWWEVFDTDREELGFLVVALISLPNFARAEADKWVNDSVPLTSDALRSHMSRVLNAKNS